MDVNKKQMLKNVATNNTYYYNSWSVRVAEKIFTKSIKRENIF